MKIVAYHTGPITHLDHLGVLAIEMGIPLVTTDHLLPELAKRYYPELSIIQIEENHSLTFLAENADVILGCGKFWSIQLREELSMLYDKQIRTVFCPHGNSDKGRTLIGNHPPQDIALLYGHHMYDLWKRAGILDQTKQIFFTGNYRAAYYQKRKLFYKECIAPYLSKIGQNTKIVFYAPTWRDKENPTPFFSIIDRLITHWKGGLHLIIKLHPFFKEHHPIETYQLLGTCASHPDITILDDDIPLIYPFLEKADIYLGDYSSVGYDAMGMNLPLYFLIEDSTTLAKCPLTELGTIIPIETIDSLTTLLEKKERLENDLTRKKLYDYCFDKVKSGEELLDELITHISTNK